jgi:outer membrane protein assembly factor BamB
VIQVERPETIMKTLSITLFLLSTSAITRAEDWPQFRGPTGLGYTTEKNLPLHWGGEKAENVAWKAPLIGEGHSSPIVSGGCFFLCTVRKQGNGSGSRWTPPCSGWG